ncbi:MAG: flippase [Oscillospiraceae bacterium]|nr:flippase [Oscillospiraceae bacterium]
MTNRAVFKNASWIVGCKIIQSLLGLIVGMQTARYLGPDNYGLVSYAAAVAAFFVPVMQLGLRSTLVQEFIQNPEEEGEILGSALVMNIVSSLICIVGIVSFVSIANRGESDTIIVCALYSVNLVFQALEMIQYWFQAKLLSKYYAIISVIAYTAVSVYKIILLITRKSIYWFAISQVLDYAIIAVSLIIIYIHNKDNQKLSFSWKRGKTMLSVSKYYIISSLMVTIFSHTDSIMLKLMVDKAATGYYTAAVSCATLTSFVFGAVIDSMRPAILASKLVSQQEFESKMKQLVSVVVWMALAQSVIITVFAKLLVVFLYGDAYTPAADALRIVTWYSAFSYLGSVRNIWILAEDKHRFLWIVNLVGALGNVILNTLLIPVMGVGGAALASVITQLATNVGMGFIIPTFRPYNKLMIKGTNPRYALNLLSGFRRN